MFNRLLKTLAVLLAPLAALAPGGAHAYSLDAEFDCKAQPHDFISGLVSKGYIEPTPMRVEANSVNAFRPVHGSDLTAFGFRVYAVLGYEQDDTMFKKGDGKAIDGPLYGVVLSGPSDTVEMRVRESGSAAVAHEVLPLLLTAVICGPP
jgi:hypothetical protein